MKFDDGGTGSGSFIYDEDTGHISAVSISTTAGSTLSGYIYIAHPHVPTVPSPLTNASFVSLSGIPTAPMESILLFYFDPQISNAGGVVDLLGNSHEGICNDHIFCYGASTDAIRYVTSGFLQGSVVPVPASVLLFGSGLIGLVGVARKIKV